MANEKSASDPSDKPLTFLSALFVLSSCLSFAAFIIWSTNFLDQRHFSMATEIVEIEADKLAVQDFSREAEFMGVAHVARAVLAGRADGDSALLACIRQQGAGLSAWLLNRAVARSEPHLRYEILSSSVIDAEGVLAFCQERLA